jgi:hypothetical protein
MSLDKQRLKKEIVDSLREVPFINHTMKKVAVSRMTFYRWLKDDKTFRYNVHAALQEGHKNMIEVAESALFKKIRSEHFGAIKFYLENNHGNYMTRKYVPRSTSDRVTEDSPNPIYERIPQITVLDDEQTEHMNKLYEIAKKHNYSKAEVDIFVKMIEDGTFADYLHELRLKYGQNRC